MARLSTHVLDTMRGVPAAGVAIELHRLDAGNRQPIASTITNADGRTDRPLLTGDRLEPGVYEITFRAGDYFAGIGVATTEPPFLGDVVIRIGIADATGNYHVPLLISPYGYSTYRGS